jgi:hypothetical protein
MKKIAFILAGATTLMAGIIFTGYRSSTQKQEVSQAQVLYASQNLNEAQKAANAEEWIAFKSESELKIRDYEINIDELNVKMSKQGEISDAHYKKKIAYLEQKIKYINARLGNYEKSPGNWESFKPDFNHEMNAIGNELKALTVESK